MRRRSRRRRAAWSLVACLWLAAIGCTEHETQSAQADAQTAPDAGTKDDEVFYGCASACEMKIRPHLLIGLYPDDERAADVRMSMENAAGTIQVSPARGKVPHGPGQCGDIPVSTCSFTFGIVPQDDIVRLTLEDGANPPLVFTVKLGAFNYCSRDITYVPIHRDEAGGGWSAGTVRYVSPCDTL